ncbi:ComF family protein [Streptomyces sp. SID5643]|uniref:ComF family protein n=1 Tax=Streptomyces sp. SID5643 TaxID=2690307 RepID=UPI001370FD63|nr:ComF family protein [Streptomyces sp. SID5643]MZF85068.1 ComF family protein [Streptomyces sp. SID5643]
MRGWWQDLTDLVLPGECGGCGEPRTALCARCRAVLGGTAVRRVRPVPEPPGLPVVHAAARYADEVRATLLAHKERGALALAGPLGAALAEAVRAGLRDARPPAWAGGARLPDGRALVGGARPPDGRAPVLLVPVPSGRRAVRARGHDPARRIALAAAGELRRWGLPARVAGVLRQRRAVADQAGLNSRQRLDNLAGALAVAPGGARLLSGGAVVLVDDVMTTGASLAEAARAVRAVSGGRRTAFGVTGPIPNASSTSAVYAGETWESREEQNVGSRWERTGRWPARQVNAGAGDVGGVVEVVCAAVVAATPDSFEINRN